MSAHTEALKQAREALMKNHDWHVGRMFYQGGTLCESTSAAIKAIDAALSLPDPGAAPVVPQWLPIETAPKDGKRILVNFPTKGVREVFWGSPFHDEVTAENGIWCVDDDKHGPYGLRGYNDEGPTAPTAWMPLPPAPHQEQAGQEGAQQ